MSGFFDVDQLGDGILNPPEPFQIRADCKSGCWRNSNSDILSDKKISFLLVKKPARLEGRLGNQMTEEKRWIQIFLVGTEECEWMPKKTVSVLYIKTRSMDNLMQAIIPIMATGKDPSHMVYSGTLEKASTTTDDGQPADYYYLKWSIKDPQNNELKLAEEVINFIDSDPEIDDPRIYEFLRPAATTKQLMESKEKSDAKLKAAREKARARNK